MTRSLFYGEPTWNLLGIGLYGERLQWRGDHARPMGRERVEDYGYRANVCEPGSMYFIGRLSTDIQPHTAAGRVGFCSCLVAVAGVRPTWSQEHGRRTRISPSHRIRFSCPPPLSPHSIRRLRHIRSLPNLPPCDHPQNTTKRTCEAENPEDHASQNHDCVFPADDILCAVSSRCLV